MRPLPWQPLPRANSARQRPGSSSDPIRRPVCWQPRRDRYRFCTYRSISSAVARPPAARADHLRSPTCSQRFARAPANTAPTQHGRLKFKLPSPARLRLGAGSRCSSLRRLKSLVLGALGCRSSNDKLYGATELQPRTGALIARHPTDGPSYCCVGSEMPPLFQLPFSPLRNAETGRPVIGPALHLAQLGAVSFVQ